MAYGDIKISELTAVTASADSDILPVVQSGSTKKASIAQIKIPVLASPAMTGTPTAPTPAVGDDSTRVATTEFVNDEINNDRPYSSSDPLINGIAAQGTSDAISREDHVHPSDTSKADLDSPALTGIPTAPTASVTTDTTQIATTEFVNDEIAHNTRYLTDFRVWTSGRAYAINDPVFYEGVPYRSLQADNTNNQPDISPTYWEVTGGGSDASNPGVTFDNPDFESSTTGWSTYKDAAQATPEDGTGGTALYTALTRDSSNPLIGNGSGLITKSTGNSQGEGISYDFTIDRGIVHEEMKIEFQYEASANYADGYIGVFLYDKTNTVLIPISVQDIPASYGKPGTFLATFIPSTSTEYRLIFHITTSVATAWTMMIDNVVVGNKDIAVGAAIGEWQSYTPIITGAGTVSDVSCFWRRIGDVLEVTGRATSGSVDANIASISLPSGLTQKDYTINRIVGQWWRNLNSANNGKRGAIQSASNGNLVYMSNDSDVPVNSPFSATAFNLMIGSSQVFSFMFSVRIAQWTSNVNLASDFTEYVYNTQSTINTSDSSSFGYGSEGTPILSNTIVTFYDVQFKKPVQNGDVISLEFQSNVDKTWIPMEYAGVDSLGIPSMADPLPYGTEAGYFYHRGFALTKVAANRMRVRVPRVLAGTAGNWEASSTPQDVTLAVLKSVSDGYSRWRVRKVSNGNMAEVPPLVRAEYTIDTQTPTSSPQIIQASTKVEDTHNAVTTAPSWKFTAPISGLYLFSFAADASVSQASNWYVNFYLCKNGTGIPGLISSKLNPGLNVGCDTGGSRVIRLNPGDYVDLRWASVATLTANISGGTIQITRIGS